MKKSTSILTFLVAAALALSACAPKPFDPAPSIALESTLVVAPTSGGVETTPAPPIATPVASAEDGPSVVTLDDQGKTIQMQIGRSFLLKLGELNDWELTISDQSVVSRARNIAVVRGAQGVYDALQAGTATLTATGDPLCRQSKPACGMPSILFTVTVGVK